ncbi:MAG: hypothetical protein HKN31_14925, partial [Pricia sp.]|nr:hypothetical protein [Pricia sp.]
AEDMQAVLACLIEAERKKEDDYNSILGHPDIPREVKNSLKEHRKEAESNLKYFQSAKETVEHKN